MINFENILGWFYVFINGLDAINISCIITALIILIIVLGSAFLSATIAETRDKSMFIHFFGGLLLPIAYPVLINKKLENITKVNKNKKEELRNEVKNEINMKLAKVQYDMECKKLVKKGMPIPEFIDWFNTREASKTSTAQTVIKEDDAASSSQSAVDRKFLENMAVDSNGNPQGPFRAVLSDGRELTVQHIKNIMDEIAAFEIVDHNGVTKNIRIKYAAISTFERIAD